MKFYDNLIIEILKHVDFINILNWVCVNSQFKKISLSNLGREIILKKYHTYKIQKLCRNKRFEDLSLEYILKNPTQILKETTIYHDKYIEFYLNKLLNFIRLQTTQSNSKMINYYKQSELPPLSQYTQMIMNHETQPIESIKDVIELLTDSNETDETKSKIQTLFRSYYTNDNQLLPWLILYDYFHVLGKMPEYYKLFNEYEKEFLELYPELIPIIEKRLLAFP